MEGIRRSRVFVIVYQRRDQRRKYLQIRHPNLEKQISFPLIDTWFEFRQERTQLTLSPTDRQK